ncbi:hypothetical protein RO3G_09214 [Rhizopus delemar RA 99-880]|uniref:Uncharacterized protein n=1 Tax=Rhizopus delemar (strain RA 99-880 / ATCC MYA-4621 / FGSC 9543 / NRRL 43880) TaxID=246409 RepID=I1C7S4_RHIO9|nr:hypothetical protein RO3G_09214 [Rhizopus delemar RA 99-880]|eukprot:EIE84504.1 hypothetical protein RO3G_09214 [Rhizopus delemar RA 99-880]
MSEVKVVSLTGIESGVLSSVGSSNDVSSFFSGSSIAKSSFSDSSTIGSSSDGFCSSFVGSSNGISSSFASSTISGSSWSAIFVFSTSASSVSCDTGTSSVESRFMQTTGTVLYLSERDVRSLTHLSISTADFARRVQVNRSLKPNLGLEALQSLGKAGAYPFNIFLEAA